MHYVVSIESCDIITNSCIVVTIDDTTAGIFSSINNEGNINTVILMIVLC